MTAGPITVCVPVWNAEPFLAATLASIAAQTYPDLRVLISLDRSDDGSEAICRHYLGDRRFRLLVQRERLGWVGNTNALIAAVETERFCIAPHDDLLAPDYVRRLAELLDRDAAIATAYSDITTLGTAIHRVVQPEVRGDRLHRLLEVMLHHVRAVAFRGLIRRRSATDRPYLPTGVPDDFAADTVWLVELAGRGELRRLPESLCRKRLHAGSTHAGWMQRPPQRIRAGWIDQAAHMAHAAAAWLEDDAERQLVAMAAMMRLAGRGAARRPALPETPELRRVERTLLARQLEPLRMPDAVETALSDPRAAPLAAARRLARARDTARSGNLEAALALAADAAAIDPEGGAPRAAQVEFLGALAIARMRAADPAGAVAAADAALAIDGHDYRANLARADLDLAAGERGAALSRLRRLDAICPDSVAVAKRLRRIDGGAGTAPP